MAEKPSIPKGTRDFTPVETARRNYIFNTIRARFQLYGYQPIETPAMENLSTLLGKYGEEGDKLLFRILNSGDFFQKVPGDILQSRDSSKAASALAEKGLRYDLTVPFARFVVQHRNELAFPFKRYQIQPVWRADRPQKGRYREFYQCDADVIGSDSLLNESELLELIDAVFTDLNLKVVIKINNRKILTALAEYIGHPDKVTDITVAIDKMDKIGREKVNEELLLKGISAAEIEKLQPVLALSGSNEEKMDALHGILSSSSTGAAGIEELKKVFAYLENTALNSELELDLTLARGLHYYTGAIIEVKSAEMAIGSICGGGRYDDLTGIFGLNGVSGVGISFGADRIYDVLDKLDRFPQETGENTKVLFVNFGEEEEKHSLSIVRMLRAEGITAELYPDPAKMKKQFSYANSRSIPFVATIGEDEIKQGLITLKDMAKGTQQSVTFPELITAVRENR